MKRIIYFLVLTVCINTMISCVSDDTVFPDKVIPEVLDVEVDADTFFNVLGVPFEISPRVDLKPLEQQVTYTWRSGFVNKQGVIESIDSLVTISNDTVLHYVFPQLGEYKVRLEVSNGKMMRMKEFRVLVRTVYDQGLLVFSDQEGAGRISFLPLDNEAQVLTASTEQFIQRPVENLNPNMKTEGMTDVRQLGSELFVTSSLDNTLYRLDGNTFEEITTYRFGDEWTGNHLKCFLRGSSSYGTCYVLSEEGKVAACELDLAYMVPDPKFSGNYDRLISWSANVFGMMRYDYFIIIDENDMHFIGTYESMGSGSYLDGMTCEEGYEILNGYGYMDFTDARLILVLKNKMNPTQYMVQQLAFTQDRESLDTYFAPYASKILTVENMSMTAETQLLYNENSGVIYYFNGSDFYLWNGPSSNFLDFPILSVDGEITCLAATEDQRYIYMGIWQENSTEELKGSVYLYDVGTNKIVKKYTGVADKPVRIFYKTRN